VSFKRTGGRSETIAGSHLLVATGRMPNTEKLGLEAAGIETDERGFIRVTEGFFTLMDNVDRAAAGE
jgi:pyruvate/2-oxoglutarate dehydrogenase complex dihydrolipoamide dehydrogenase (E3) component